MGGKLSPEAHWKRCLTWTKKRNPITCSVCGSIFIPLAGFDNRGYSAIRTCSPECLKVQKSLAMKERHCQDPGLAVRLGQKGGKISAQRQCRRSKDEISLYKLCEEFFDDVDHNRVIIDGWDADIIINDTKTAILWNGPWHYQEMPLSNHSLKQVQKRDEIKLSKLSKAGWNVIIFEDRYYTPKSAFEELLQAGGTE